MSELHEMTLDFKTFRLTALLNIGKVVYMHKFDGQCETYTIEQFCNILDRISEKHRRENDPCYEEKRLSEEKLRLEQTLERLRSGKTKAERPHR